MPGPNDPSLRIDPRLGSLRISAADHLDALPSEWRGAPIAFGPAAAAGEAGTLGPYRVVRELGRGGMGAVFLAVDTRLDRRLALKVMLPEVAADAGARERFLREARAAARIGHDHVVTVFEADERDGVPYIAMQLLEGYPLDAFVQKTGSPSLRSVVRIAREAALGLGAAHKLGVVHRDVKPANLWLEAPHGRVKLLDFGLARADGLDAELTGTGVLIGTPAFMSPEQALDERVDHRTDLFSLGAVLYWLCTGRLPFPGPSVGAVLKALSTEEPQPVLALNPALPGPLAELIHQLLARAPGGRPRTATEVANRLSEIAESLTDAPAPLLIGNADPASDPSEDADPWAMFLRTALSQVEPPPLLAGAPKPAEDVDPWLTFVRSAASQQAGPPPLVTNEPRLIHSMRVVTITPADPAEEPPEPKPDAMRTVISSGILWEEVEEPLEVQESPERAKRAKIEDEPQEPSERTGRRPRRAAKRAGRRRAGPTPLLVGMAITVLVLSSVLATLLVVGGKKWTELGGGVAKSGEPVRLRAEEDQESAQVPVVHPKEPDNAPPLALSPIAVALDDVPKIIGGGSSPRFKDLSPEGGLLIGLELGIGRYNGDDVIQAGRAIYRVGGREVLGAPRGTSAARRVVTLRAREGYAVGAITCKHGANFDGCSLTFMRVAAGRLDPRDRYESEWAGYDGPKQPVRLGGDGAPVVGLVGRATDTQMFGLGPLFKGQEAWDVGPAEAVFGATEVVLGAKSGPAFRDEAPPGGLLIGLDVWCSVSANSEVLDGVRPIYRTGDRHTFGELRGRAAPRAYRAVARPGYAVGGLSAKVGAGPDSFVVVFMRVKGDRLDPNDAYQSGRFGGPGGNSHPVLGGDGTPVTGIVGRVDGRSKLSGLGLAFPKR